MAAALLRRGRRDRLVGCVAAHVILAWRPPSFPAATDVAGEDATVLLLGRGRPRASLSGTYGGYLPLPVPDGFVSSDIV
jgi:hypothetical protein